MSSMKWNLSTQKTPFISTSGLRSFRTNLQLHKEEVVQRLFKDQEEEKSVDVSDKKAGTNAEQLPLQASTIKACCNKVGRTSEDEEEMTASQQPFFQAPERESVIFFSSSKKLFRVPQCEKQENSEQQQRHKEILSGSVLQIRSSVQSLHRDPGVQKTCGLSPVAAMLRLRFPPLEELRMDEEVATYTAVSVSTTLGFLPTQPRCGNPLASILLFKESSMFVPIESSDL
ncbi:uncharacterized protein LOC117512297 [Thalassophryne amazonica]|uniref:uncharacterized protein LOC117512297 n=1 Tax=Thalassophryne amazonica TaxID=390379 RepID=UPI001470B7BA|nr:uncharacterized protein LOC117512297 [Thalassophryne amazonica]